MGCGASKVAASIDEKSITIRNSPDREHPQNVNFDKKLNNEKRLTNENHLPHPKQVHNVTTAPSINDHTTSFVPHGLASSNKKSHDQSILEQSDITLNKYPPPVAFDVPLNEDGSPMERKAFPKKLEKIHVSLPALTKEQLDEKQRVVSERKEKELKKRKESRGRKASQIRREIMEARETEVDKSTKSNGGGLKSLQEESESLTGNLETDVTYNATTSEEDIWNES